MKKVIQDYLYFIRKSRKVNKKYFVYFFCDTFFKIISPFALVVFPRYILNEIVTTRRIEYIAIELFLMVLIDITTNLLVQIFSPLLNHEIQCLRNELSVEFSKKVLELDYEKIENPKIMDKKQKVIEFVYGSEGLENVTFSAENILVAIGKLIGYGYILITCNPIIIVFIIAASYVNAKWHGKAERYSYDANNEVIRENRQGSYLDFVCSDYEHYKDIRFFDLKNWILEKKRYYNDIKLSVFKKVSKKFVRLGFMTTLLNNVLTVIYYTYLLYLLFVNRIIIGDFTMYLSSISSFSNTANNIAVSVAKIVQADMRLSCYIEFMNLENNMVRNDSDEKAKECPKQSFVIEFEDVSFHYPFAKEWVLRHVNLSFSFGEKISVVGSNGAGKTTFIKLLMRLYDPTEGKIKLNGVDIREYNYDSYRKLFAAVFQDYHLFPFSIKENIAFDKYREVPDDKVSDLLNEVGLSYKISNLKNGIYTGLSKQFDEEGTDLSGGESQKIAIARTLYRDSPIVVLDEPTSALDPVAEYEIYQKYNSMVSGKTSIFISHRMASTRLSDRIFVFKKGELIENGTHKQLMENEGEYCKMYLMQKEYYE